MLWTREDEVKYQRKKRQRREIEAARLWRNDALETAARIAERHESHEAARDIRALIA